MSYYLRRENKIKKELHHRFPCEINLFALPDKVFILRNGLSNFWDNHQSTAEPDKEILQGKHSSRYLLNMVLVDGASFKLLVCGVPLKNY